LNDSTGTLNNYGMISAASGAYIYNLGTVNNYGNIANDAGSSFTNAGTLTNSGTLNNTLGATLANSGILNNTGGTLYIDSTSTLTNSGTITNSGTFLNSGAVTISNSGLFTTSNYIQTGGSTLVNGTLTATGSAIVNILGGALSGTGTINGNVAMGGTLTPGALGAPGAITIFGNYEQTGNGTFDELMSPLSHSFLDVSGNVSLDSGALLDISLLGGYDPLNQTFSILDFAFLNGQFANGSSFWDNGYLWDITYRQHEVDVTAVQAPEPSVLLLLLISLAPLGLYTHRKMDKTQRLA
jgi:hypothetical protein